MTIQSQLAAIPDRMLVRGAARALETWCTEHGFRPTLADIEAERRRRRDLAPTRPRRRRTGPGETR